MTTQRPWYEVLGVSPFAGDDEVRDAYLRLVKAWHPDRFASSPAASALAHERLKEVNAAYDVVKAGPGHSGAPETPPSVFTPARWTAADPDASEGPSLLFPRGNLVVRLVAFVLALVFVLSGVVSYVRALGRGPADMRRPPGAAPLPSR